MDTANASNFNTDAFQYKLPAQNIRARKHGSGEVSYSYELEFELKPEHLMDGKYMLSISLTRQSDGMALAQHDHRRSMSASSSRTMRICGSVWSEDEADPAQEGEEVMVAVLVLITVSSAWPSPFGSLVPKPNGAFSGERETPRDQNGSAEPGTYRWQVTVSEFSPSCPNMPTADVFGFLTFDRDTIVDGLELDGNMLGTATCAHNKVDVCYDEEAIDWDLQ
ncbi:hypothetical protein IT575_15150 [bacterium]|nr:hypothetical protein [bacterium]